MPIFMLLLLILIVVPIFKSIKIVPQQEVWIVETLVNILEN